ncbi:MAG: hypothetical protein NC309_01735 [Ruminococcus sp.]|nr:hypothetical protein [Ruminococcus sp.]
MKKERKKHKMKVNSDFYVNVNDIINTKTEKFKENMDDFKMLCAEFFTKNNFGYISQEMLQEIYINIYNSVALKIQENVNLITGYVDLYVSAVDADDVI